MAEHAEFAPAKVNLHLHVVGRRSDGYHELDSLVVFADVGDRLSVTPAETMGLSVVGPFAAGLQSEPDNLVLRAARALADLSVRQPSGMLVLEKNLPVASGIGGGSADAAATLRLLCRFWGISPNGSDLQQLARRLGADVPVCLTGRPALMGGTGEVLAPAPQLPGAGIVLLNPGVAIATHTVFQARSGAFSERSRFPSAGWPDVAAFTTDLAATCNDLQRPALALAPSIGEALAVLQSMPGCRLARMSGSGATCYGLFNSPAEAQRASRAVARPGWWIWGGRIRRE